LAKFQASKNLNEAISQTNIEIQRETQIKAQNEAREQREREREREEIQRQFQIQVQPIESEQEEVETENKEPKIFSTSFKVYGTKEQFIELKQFMNQNNIKYEGISK
jgi:hypothetical protein